MGYHFFPYLEYFFYFSLGITFLLIVLMVFHIKSKIISLEKKGNELTDKYNDIVLDISNLRNNNSHAAQLNLLPQVENIRMSTKNPIPLQQIYNHNIQPPFIPVSEPSAAFKKIIVMDSELQDVFEISDGVKDLDDSSRRSDSEFDYDSNSDFESDVEIEIDAESISELDHVLSSSPENETNETVIAPIEPDSILIHSVELSDASTNNVIMDIETPIRVLKLDANESIDIAPISNPKEYQKMNVQSLKMLVISKGLCSDPSKMKRAELIKLLSNPQ
jgi:hypothetical protein